MKKEYIAPDSRVIIMNITSPLLSDSEWDDPVSEPHGDIRDTTDGFEASFGEDDVDVGN